jgi:hypothetical protein
VISANGGSWYGSCDGAASGFDADRDAGAGEDVIADILTRAAPDPLDRRAQRLAVRR